MLKSKIIIKIKLNFFIERIINLKLYIRYSYQTTSNLYGFRLNY